MIYFEQYSDLPAYVPQKGQNPFHYESGLNKATTVNRSTNVPDHAILASLTWQELFPKRQYRTVPEAIELTSSVSFYNSFNTHLSHFHWSHQLAPHGTSLSANMSFCTTSPMEHQDPVPIFCSHDKLSSCYIGLKGFLLKDVYHLNVSWKQSSTWTSRTQK